MRVVQPPGRRGSLKWLQLAVNRKPALLHHPDIGDIRWVSPLAEDGFAEYRDRAFLDRIGSAELAPRLAEFWPARGPQWDALGLTRNGSVLVEAKAHLDEMLSPACMAGPQSRARISKAFGETRAAIGAVGGADWTVCFYQLANRLAHLHFLRRNHVNAHLLLVGFVGDEEMNGPRHAAEWIAAYRVAEYTMGLPRRHALSAYLHHVHPDTGFLADVPAL